MAITDTTYYSFTRIREQSPEARDWATVDWNWEVLSRILRAFEDHVHDGAQAINFPGYNESDPPNPTLVTLTEQEDEGALTPGTIVGVRLSFVNSLGLETMASPEVEVEVAEATDRPLTPELVGEPVATVDAVPGGTYVYGITKVKDSGETEISDLLPVTIPYDDTYGVTISFEAISTYTDGTTQLNIYRSEGLSQPFVRVAQITDGEQTEFTDENAVDEGYVQPPSQNTFDINRAVLIDWSTLDTPTDAVTLRVYVTQETHLWGTNHLLFEDDLSDPVGSFLYTGLETLSAGWPKDSSEVISHPSQINLATEVTGALTFDADYNAAGYYIRNLSLNALPNITKTDGMIWYDASTDQFIGRSDGTDIVLGSVSGSYSHPAESSGGHIADNIPFKAGSSVSVKDILDRYVDTDGAPKAVTPIVKQSGTSGQISTSATSFTVVPDMGLTVTPDFVGQWIELDFNGQIFISNTEALATFDFMIAELDLDVITSDDWARSVQGHKAPSFGSSDTIHLHQMYQATSTDMLSVLVRWKVSAGAVVLASNRRQLVIKKVI